MIMPHARIAPELLELGVQFGANPLGGFRAVPSDGKEDGAKITRGFWTENETRVPRLKPFRVKAFCNHFAEFFKHLIAVEQLAGFGFRGTVLQLCFELQKCNTLGVRGAKAGKVRSAPPNHQKLSPLPTVP